MTYTALAVDVENRLVGAATASFSLAVGNAVIATAPGIGAVASQAYTNRMLRAHVLDRLRVGDSPAQAITRIPEWDDDAARRQVAVIDLHGRSAAHTGAGCSEWAGSLSGDGAVVVGNLLAGPAVLDAMLAALENRAPVGDEEALPPGAAFARRLLRALDAGEAAGGDRRGRQSAAIQVAPFADSVAWPPERSVDLRVDDSPDPLTELHRLLSRQFAG
ncbi:Uncharacterized conserved protein, Ntn-hydrolase superfamily [Paramicrobacterium humi]|uniref:Uncharacterized conserved protein, Ntn-hydrolase superfamily n=1 Tax=Paramicrobacterium humi TaxID=640635 RepID=A0A1H4KL44_9MICO|nr:DUF1028 domain-containing protein [Microbacterium humi]SEB59240.1 Uncharacterized conserved protein, Ntn-hydrolase superfamily [Microbacterium humi]